MCLARISLPVEAGFMKLLDLDRCYSKSWIPVADGRHLVLYNLHLSAYSNDGTIADEQLALLTADMKAEYEAGNYVVGGGDFNKDYFTKIDIRYDKDLKFYSKSAQLLSTHPAGSYQLAKDKQGQYELHITDPQKFWSVSKYLVVQVK